jgi:hypothetical protein
MIERTHPADVIRISAEDLFAGYDKNEVSANHSYLHKVLIIKGTVRAIRQEQGRIYVDVEGDKYGFTPIRCLFPQGKGGELTSYAKGHPIVLKGMSLGKTSMGIVLVGCKTAIW